MESGIDEMLSAHRAFFSSGATRPAPFRLEALRRLRQVLRDHEKALCEALREDLHKSESETYLTEIGPVLGEIGDHIRHLKRWMRGRTVPTPWTMMPSRSRIEPEPLGTALIVAPWNYPVQLLLSPLAGALSAGCCAVLKSSPLVPRTEAVLAGIVAAAFDPSHVSFVKGGADRVTALLERRFDYIFFTGSPDFGRVVMEAASRHLTPVTLELGGKSPCIVGADADIPVAARRIVWGKLLNAGQTCIAPDYLLVHERCRDRLVAEMKRTVRAFYGPDPRQSPDYPRIVTPQAVQRLEELIRTSGGKVLFGGETDPSARYVAPTLIADPDDDSPLMTREIFGPVLPVKTFAEIGEAIGYVNAREKPLALYYFGRRDEARRVLRSTSSGGACVNDTVMHIANRRLPFGGVGRSGIGSYHGRLTFEAFSHLRAVVRAPARPDIPLRYPPFRRPGLFRRLFG